MIIWELTNPVYSFISKFASQVTSFQVILNRGYCQFEPLLASHIFVHSLSLYLLFVAELKWCLRSWNWFNLRSLFCELDSLLVISISSVCPVKSVAKKYGSFSIQWITSETTYDIITMSSVILIFNWNNTLRRHLSQESLKWTKFDLFTRDHIDNYVSNDNPCRVDIEYLGKFLLSLSTAVSAAVGEIRYIS